MRLSELLRRMRRSKFFIIGSVMVLIMVLLAIIAPYIVVHDATTSDLSHRLEPPQWLNGLGGGYVLGTDALGRDILTRVLLGGRASLIVAFFGVLVPVIVGTILGVLAGYYGGMVETIIMRISEIQAGIPGLVLAITIASMLGPSMFNLVLVLLITGWISYAKQVRISTKAIAKSEFVQASRVLGASDLSIMFRQILPNVLTPIIILISQSVGTTILFEASLSFLGLGVPLPEPSWGNMIAEGREYLTTAPWTVLAPGIALMLAVLAFNFLGDGVRDVLDPKNLD